MKLQKFIEQVIRFRWYIVIIIPLLTLGMMSQLKHLEFEGSYRIWFGESSPLLKEYDDFRSVFGNDDAITITFRDENGIFNPDALGVIERITEKLWRTHYIARVDSLTGFQHVHSDPEYPDEIVVEDLIIYPETLDAAALELKKEIALSEDLLVGRLISKDAKTAMIVGRMTPKSGDDPEVSFRLKAAVEEIVRPETEKYGYHFYLNGGPVINSAFITIAQHDMGLFTPLALLIAMVLLWLIFRRPSAMLLSIGVVIFTFLIVLSVQVMLGFKLNNFTANMPVFVIAIGIADAMHLLLIYFVGRRKGMENYEAIHYSVHKNFLAILFTSLTTAVGFASLAISPVIPIKTLGIATANAALLAFVLTILFIPAMLAILNPKVKKLEEKSSKSSRFADVYGAFVIRNDKHILIVTLLLFLGLGIGITQIKVDSNTVRYFTENVPFRASVDFLQENLTGPMVYEVIVDSKEKDGIKAPEFLHKVEDFYREFKAKYPEDVRHIGSLMDVVKKFNEVMNHDKNIPESKPLIAQYLLLYSLSLPQGMEINDMMDVEEQRFRITATMNLVDTSKDIEMIAWVESWWSQTPYSAKVNGQTVLFAHMQSDVTDMLIKSITIAITAVSLMMMLIFRDLRLLPLLILPNILPIVLVVGVMGWLHINIDIGVAVSGAIIIGVAVDDTIHFLVKFFEARKRGETMQASLSYVMQYAGNAIIFTTIILSAAFLIFVFSDFYPNFHFGVVTASALVIAVIADLLMLPAIFSLLERRKKSDQLR
ncbi:MAG: hypothetical protein DRG24_03965 [Epsilonproteobacteria bacterium]|nr:MAG: hypothetical protein DRG24_03965 [Campylobacterota bacterium]